jgi:nucleotide-binding universal stress UspA family protein
MITDACVVEPADESQNQLVTTKLPEKMKKILVPFDFNEVSINAVKYAFEAFSEDTEFVILHIIDGNLDLNDPLTYTAGFTRGDALIIEMDSIINDLVGKLDVDITFKTQLEIGSVVENLILQIEKEHFDAVVMGTRDKYDVVDRWFGTVSLGVVKRSKTPVYLIPKDCVYKAYKKVVVAADKHLESDNVIEMLVFWNDGFKADMHFLHVLDGKKDNENFVVNIVEEFFEKRDLDFPFSIVQKDKGNIADAIIHYADDKDMDLQIVISDKMSWFETLTSNSVSKQMILKATRPMLFVFSGYKKKSQMFYQVASF